jgi:hypothetical protein
VLEQSGGKIVAIPALLDWLVKGLAPEGSLRSDAVRNADSPCLGRRATA